ncbi:U2 small nuclear ribonucleoprotein A' [Hibiscus syriacus]|uniref:U2 small nuclear ribonucleoprotein A n=1 Tax=Hibiscus syriacus TaxID=106335 RepID=A0A6A2YN24_HIBSY|nr:U2 small nuclear ribonucleoprotein A' [Hibiscus syriacus]
MPNEESKGAKRQSSGLAAPTFTARQRRRFKVLADEEREKKKKVGMVKLTADLIWKCPHFFNPLKERELDLRGNKIAVIENLGATEDQFDTIDLSDNEIVKLDNFPYLKRLGTYFSHFPCPAEFLPKLHTLVLTNNRLVNLVEIDPLASLPKLQFLSLLDNNITKKPNYRLYVIHKLKSLRVLDFKKVKAKICEIAVERLEAENLFASKEVEEEIKKESAKTVAPKEVPNVSEVAEEEETPKVVAPTPEQIIAIKAAIVNSQTLEEVARLEKALKTGLLPADLNIPGFDTNVAKGGDEKGDSDNQNEANAEPDKMDEEKNEEAAPMEQGLWIGGFNSSQSLAELLNDWSAAKEGVMDFL